MPEATPVLGLPYPLVGETVDPTAFADLANALDTLLTAMDAEFATVLDRPAVYVSESGTAGVTQAVETTVTLSETLLTYNFDSDGMFNPASPNQLTVQTPGIYMIHVLDTVLSAFTTITSVRYAVYQNGVLRYAERKNEASSGAPTTTLTGLLVCAAGDTIDVRVLWTGTGGPANLIACELQAHWVCEV